MPVTAPNRRRLLLAGAASVLLPTALSGCATGIPDGVQAVRGFELERYLGQWYAMARLDHRFERGLSRVSATYTRRDDGSVNVLNRGYDAQKGQWRQVEGRARFIGDPGTASLKVSFFGPFFGGYHVVDLDPDYRWALVMGPTRGYFWILARDTQAPPALRERWLARARSLGIDTDALIWVDQSPLPG
jgi:apolipoprotein D and lipocalin family protein